MILCNSNLQARNDRDTLGTGRRIVFSENLGQWDSHILFRSQMHSASLFVEKNCFTFVVQHPENANLQHPAVASTQRYRTHAYRMLFEGGNTSYIEGTDKESGHENYFIGRDKSRWVSNVGIYESLLYHDLYKGIDMKVYAATEAMKYDFIVHPGSNPDAITIRYDGTNGLKLQNGNLLVKTSVIDIVELRPFAYQMDGEQQVEVEARYILKGDRVSFAIGNYDTSKVLIIDPYLYFSTYTGSTADNWGTTGCYDSYKNTYTSGVVFGTGYPVSLGSYDGTYNGNCDIGIFKFNTTGSQRLYATYLGGSLADMPHSMFVNSFDELVIFGTTGSNDFPVTATAFDTSFNGGDSLAYEGSNTISFRYGSDIFICRFSSDGSQLQASTYVGGTGNDGLNYRNSFNYATIMLGNDSLYFNYGDGARGEIITDDLNNIYVGSTTSSTDFPVTANCLQPNCGGRQDGVVFKIDYNLSNMLWSTYLGGGKDDAVYSVDCDNEYNVVVCGGTNSLNFPTTSGGYDHSYNGGSADAFITKISYYGTSMMAGTYFGSSSYDQAYFVRCGKHNDIFVFGQTKATGSTLIHNANYNTPSSGQFLVRFKPDLDSVRWSTVFGTGDVATKGPNISPTAFAVDICNRIYLSGWGRIFLGRNLGSNSYQWYTRGTTGLTVTNDAYQDTTDGQDFYIMSMDMDANALVYATFFGEIHSNNSYYSGGDHVDGGTSRFDRLGTLYQSVCASCSGGDDFPVTTGAYGQHNNSNNCNNAIFRLNLTDDFPVAEFTPPESGCAPISIEFHNTGRGDSFLWDFGDGTTSTATNPSHTYSTAGIYTIQLVAYMPNGCRPTDTIQRTLVILGSQPISLDTLETCPGTPLQIGLPPEYGFTYRWIGSSVSDSSISNPFVTQPGTYTLFVSSGNSCTDTLTQVVLPGETFVQIIGDTLTCSSPTSLSATAEGFGVSYLWSTNRDFSDTLNDNLEQSLINFFPTGDQWFYLHVVDELGCYKTDSIHVSFQNIFDHVETIAASCPGFCDATAVLLTTPLATHPISYHWGDGWHQNDSIRTDLCPGDREVWIRDSAGCEVLTSFTVPDAEPPDITASLQHINCLESCTGSISVTVSGNSVYSILWLDDSSSSYVRDSLCAGIYYLQVTDSNGCIFFKDFQVLDNADFSIQTELLHNSCTDLCSGSATVNLTGGTPPYSIVWSNGEQTDTAIRLCEGTSYITATDALGCQVTDSVVIPAYNSFDNINVWADDSVVFSGNSTTIHATPIYGINYWWSPSSLVTNPSAATTTTLPLSDTTTFIVTLSDTAGCTYSDSVTVRCITISCGKPDIFIPNAFTPNNDGKNDELCFSGDWIDEFHIAIFTRWGEKVFESDNITECWDGRFRDNPCMPGVYVYYCRIRCSDGQVSTLKGDVTLIR